MKKLAFELTFAQMASDMEVSTTYLKRVLKISKEKAEPDPELEQEIMKVRTDLELSKNPKEILKLETKLNQLCLNKIREANTVELIKAAYQSTRENSLSEKVCFMKWKEIAQTDAEKAELQTYCELDFEYFAETTKANPVEN
jgi:hypothetical protein